MKILTILGARPQFIKAGTVSREFIKHSSINEIIVHTGQHYDKNMSDIFFEEMQIPKPNYFLGVGGLSHGKMTGQMILGIEDVALKEKPDLFLVYGDTNSTLAGALVASKLQIKLAHIEAGLRSFNMKMPEEVNRILTDRVSNFLFCPTESAVNNLIKEGFSNYNCEIMNSGDVMKDGALFYRNLAVKPKYIPKIEDKYILCTIHRAENTDNELNIKGIIESLIEVSNLIPVVIPLHPRTKKIIKLLNIELSNLIIIEPVGYLQMVWLIDNCDFVITDSGGLQKEAYFFEKKCITIREETEWVELVDSGSNTLVGSNKEKILKAVEQNIKNSFEEFNSDFFGTGHASEKIVNSLLS